MSAQEIEELLQRVADLEQQLSALREQDAIREVEFQSLRQDVALKAAYIAELESVQEKVIAPKDVHIRNLEAIIAELRANVEANSIDEPKSLIERAKNAVKRHQ